MFTVRIALNWLLLILLSSGCTRHQRGDPPSVRTIVFEESSDDGEIDRLSRGTSDFFLRQAIQQESSPFGAYFLPWIKPVPIDEEKLAMDAWRVEVWYAHHGFFDSRFRGWELRPLSTHRDGSPKTVRIVGYVREGPPSVVRDIHVTGLDGLGSYAQRLLRRASLAQGERFSLDGHRATISRFENFLRDNGFARAEVRAEAAAHTDERVVDLTYAIEGASKGEQCTFGPIEIEGGDGVPDLLIRETFQFKQGEVYSAKKLSETQLRLFALGAFSVVRVTPDLSVDGTAIPIRITLAEAKPRELKLGAGLGVESGEQQIRASTGFRHANWLNRLWQIEGSVFAGYKSFGATEDWLESGTEVFSSNGGPFADGELRLTVPRPLGNGTQFRQTLEVERGLEQATSFLRWGGRPTLTYLLNKQLSLSAGYRFEHWTGDLNEDLLSVDAAESLLENYRISALEQSVILDMRDKKIDARRGLYVEGKLTEAGLGAGFRFWKASLDMRRYWSLKRPSSVFSVRLAGGAARPHSWWGKDEALAYVPYAERFLLGGSSSVRGWETNHLGPLACSDDAECVPLGAQAVTWASVQWRFKGAYDISPVLFVDTGMAWPSLEDVRFSSLEPSAGLGVRYGTPVGPLRLDLAWRLRDTEVFEHAPKWAIHAGLGEAF